GFAIERDCMRENYGMRIRMRQVECAAKHMAKLVMDGHSDRPQHRSGEPRAIERIRARFEISRFPHYDRQRAREGADSLSGQKCHDRIRVFRIKTLDAVSDR